ncbi:ATP-binding protein [Streptomyces sp. NPDC005574]|uniref:ATP-binding protein n=1 Tax=Streptomyces sp. NPDC005574 TaxID=3156891 RepID=UPI0033A78455
MDEAARRRDQLEEEQLLRVSEAYEGRPPDVARARDLAAAFLTRVQAEQGLPVSERALGVVQLVVSELVTNACKYAPGPSLLDLELAGGSVQITVWDSAPVLPVARAADPGRVGQHGLEIVMAVCQSFEVHREPVGKRTTASVMLADDPGGDVAGHEPLS